MFWVWLSGSCSSALGSLVVCLPTRVRDFQQLVGVSAAWEIQDEARIPEFYLVYLRGKTGTKRKARRFYELWMKMPVFHLPMNFCLSAGLLTCRIGTILIFGVVRSSIVMIESPNYLITLQNNDFQVFYSALGQGERGTAGTSLAGILWRCIAFFCAPLITSACCLWCWCSGLIGLILLLQEHQSAVNKSLLCFSFFLLSTVDAF